MKIWMTAAAGLLALPLMLEPAPSAAQAADPEATRVAQELVDLTVTGNLREMMVQGSWPPIEQMLRQNALKLSDDEVASLKSDFTGLLRKELDDTMADTPRIYAKYFSAAELKDMLAFYKTETGRKTLAVLPAMTEEIMAQTNDRAPAMMQRIMGSFGAILQKRGVKTP